MMKENLIQKQRTSSFQLINSLKTINPVKDHRKNQLNLIVVILFYFILLLFIAKKKIYIYIYILRYIEREKKRIIIIFFFVYHYIRKCIFKEIKDLNEDFQSQVIRN